MTALIVRDRIDGSKADTANGVNVANFLLGTGNVWDCLQTIGVGVSSIAAGTATLTQANAGLALIDASAGNVIINLPACIAAAGALFQFKRVDTTANTVTINRAGGDTIDGQASVTLSEALDFVEMRSDGVSSWRPLNNTVVAAKELLTTGPATAYAIAPMPALNAYKAGRAFWVNFHVASGLNPTLQISGLATPPNLVTQQADGSYANVVGIPLNHRSLVVLLSANQALVVTMPKSAAAIEGSFKNLKASATGLSASITITADQISVGNGTAVQTLAAVNLTVVGTSVGANALDAGTLAASSWYSLWVIWNGSTTAGLMSLSATAPTLPSGYTFKARCGWVRTDASGNKYPLYFTQSGVDVDLRVGSTTNVPVRPLLGSGVQGNALTPTYVALSTVNFVPTTASRIRGNAGAGGGSSTALCLAPNDQYGAANASSNLPPVAMNTSGATASVLFDFAIESANLYYACSNSLGYVALGGWRDNL